MSSRNRLFIAKDIFGKARISESVICYWINNTASESDIKNILRKIGYDISEGHKNEIQTDDIVSHPLSGRGKVLKIFKDIDGYEWVRVRPIGTRYARSFDAQLEYLTKDKSYELSGKY